MSVDDICEFCRKYKRVFLYGAGKYGKLCRRILSKNNIPINGFIVSGSSGKTIENVPVYFFPDIAQNLSDSDAVVLSMSEKHQSEVRSGIPRRLQSQVLSVSEETWRMLDDDETVCFFKELYEYHSPVKYDGNMQWKKILVVRLDCIGDMVWTTPFFRELRGNFPDAKITLVLRPQIRPLLKNCPYIDQIIDYDVPNLQIEPSPALQEKARKFASKHLVKEAYDVVFLPRPVAGHGIVENYFLAFYSRSKMIIAPFHADLTEQNQRLYERISPFFSLLDRSTLKTHSVEYILNMLRHCNCAIKSTAMELWPTSEEREHAGSLLHKREHTVYIAIGVVANLPDRTWDSRNYKELIERCIQKYHQRVHFVLCGGANARNAAHVALEGNEMFCTDLASKTSLPEAVAVIEACDFYLGSTTGLLHIAAAVHTPIVEITYRRSTVQDSGIWMMEGRTVYPKTYADNDEEFPIDAIQVDDVEPVLFDMIDRFF